MTGRGDGLTIDGQLGSITNGVNGLSSGNSFSGTTMWRGTEGQLRGRVVSDVTFGAFNGSDATSAYAGGVTGSGRVAP